MNFESLGESISSMVFPSPGASPELTNLDVKQALGKFKASEPDVLTVPIIAMSDAISQKTRKIWRKPVFPRVF